MSPSRAVAVAASGGLDSTALLHCTARLAAASGVQVHALHVHHGLHPDADAWAAQVAAQCRRWGGIAFHLHRVQGAPARGDSVEAWARRERYRGLAALAREAGCGLVLLAQHRRDQAETVLLQALRGAGAAGLAAMPREIEREGLTWARPWLAQPRERIQAYAARWRLRCVEDPSNADARFARSRLREQLWPALLAAFPDAETTLGAVARRAQEAREVAAELAAVDAPAVVLAGGAALGIVPWLRLAPARRANLLRHWLNGLLPEGVPETLVQRLLQELPGRTAAEWPAGTGWLRLHRGRLGLVPPAGDAHAALLPPRSIDLSRPGLHALAPWRGAIEVRAAGEGAQEGVPAAVLADCILQPRRGGERFQLGAAGLPRGLKKQYQAQGVPAWAREGPLVCSRDGRLLFVPGLGTDARAQALPGAERRLLRWVG